MWFSVLAGSNEPQGCESGSGNTDVEGSSSLKDSTGWEACSDWSDWNLLENKWKRSRSAKAPSDPVHRHAETFSKETRERKTVTEDEMRIKCLFPPREELGLHIPGIAAAFRTIRTVCAGSEWPSVRHSRAQFAQRRETGQRYRPSPDLRPQPRSSTLAGLTVESS